jgi:hypothetical protein
LYLCAGEPLKSKDDEIKIVTTQPVSLRRWGEAGNKSLSALKEKAAEVDSGRRQIGMHQSLCSSRTKKQCRKGKYSFMSKFPSVHVIRILREEIYSTVSNVDFHSPCRLPTHHRFPFACRIAATLFLTTEGNNDPIISFDSKLLRTSKPQVEASFEYILRVSDDSQQSAHQYTES